MRLTVELVSSKIAPKASLERIVPVIEKAASFESGATNAGRVLTLRVSDDSEISELHERYFGNPDPTDVITFPSTSEYGDDRHLGDVVVSWQTASENAEDAGHSLAREIAFLAIHGLLHLCGYDDDSLEHRAEMLARQEFLLSEAESHMGVSL